MGIGMSTTLTTDGDDDRADQPDLTVRLRELCEAGDRTSAQTLARSVVCSTGNLQVTIDGSAVRIETDHFVGKHEWRRTGDAEFVVDDEGSYRSTIEGVDLTFSTRTINDTALERALDRLEAQVPADPAGSVLEEKEDSQSESEDGSAVTGRAWETPVKWLNDLLR